MITKLLIIVFLFMHIYSYSQNIYRFDSLAVIHGCANVFLQKISSNQLYEVAIEIKNIDSLPKNRSFKLTNYSKFISIQFNKYPKGNKCIQAFCDDTGCGTDKTPVRYKLQNGSFRIVKWDSKKQIISIEYSNALFRSNSGDIIRSPLEKFENLQVGWLAG
jgi:hypothetical protein